MPYELLACYLKLPVFLMVAARLAGMVMFQPILAAQGVPVSARVLLVLGLAALVSPLVHLALPLPDTVLELVLALGSEVLLGALIGLVVAAALMGVQLGGLLVAQESGLAFGQIADPNYNEELTVLSGFYAQLAAVVYLIVGGHRALLAACLDTFASLPLLGSKELIDRGPPMLIDALSVGCIVAIRVAAPALLTLFLVNTALGFLSRTVPQLNIATVGFALKGLIAFVVMAVALPSAVAAFVDGLELCFDYLHEFLGS